MSAKLKSTIMPVLKYATRSYVAGDELDDATALARQAASQSLACSLCYWNASREEAGAVAREYERILNAISTQDLNGLLAVKLPALWEREDLAEQIVILARARGVSVVFDSHDPERSDFTLRFLDRVGGDHLGLAIPGRWRRSLADVERAIELGARVRVVKGQWPDPEEPNMDMREGYLRIIERLAGRAAFVGVATHDAPLAAQAMAILAKAGTPFEQEFVFPLPVEAALKEGAKYDVGARLYIPYGQAWFPYSVSRALKNPKIFYWLARDLVTGRKFTLPQADPGNAGA